MHEGTDKYAFVINLQNFSYYLLFCYITSRGLTLEKRIQLRYCKTTSSVICYYLDTKILPMQHSILIRTTQL